MAAMHRGRHGEILDRKAPLSPAGPAAAGFIRAIRPDSDQAQRAFSVETSENETPISRAALIARAPDRPSAETLNADVVARQHQD